MQLIDFALLGLAIAAPAAQQSPQVDNPALTQPEVTTCPDLNDARVLSTSKQGYTLQCAKFVDAPQDQLIKIVNTPNGYKGCLEACDAVAECAVSQYVATDAAQTKGSCTLFKKGVPVKQGSSNSWTLATKTEPYSPIPHEGDKFSLRSTIYNGTELLNVTGVKASSSRITLGGSAPSNASCDSAHTPTIDEEDYATFFLNNGSLFLYTGTSATPQQVWVDRSGMGQGVTGYTTGAQPTPRNAERQGFSIDGSSGGLTFSGSPAVACPPGASSPEGSGWSLWFATSRTPGWNVGCLPVLLRAIVDESPVGCAYTQQQ